MLIKKRGGNIHEKADRTCPYHHHDPQPRIDRDKGFQEYWDEFAPAAWKVLWDEVKVNDGDAQKALTFGQDFITAYPNPIGLFTPNNGSTVGFVTALKESGRTDIVMVGFDFSAEMESIVRDPSYKVATILQRQYFVGYDGVAWRLSLPQRRHCDRKSR